MLFGDDYSYDPIDLFDIIHGCGCQYILAAIMLAEPVDNQKLNSFISDNICTIVGCSLDTNESISADWNHEWKQRNESTFEADIMSHHHPTPL